MYWSDVYRCSLLVGIDTAIFEMFFNNSFTLACLIEIMIRYGIYFTIDLNS